MSEKTLLIILTGIFLLLLAAILLLRRRSGLQQGEWVYDDLDGEGGKPLYSRKYSLSGKPDLILRKGSQWIPVEVKSSAAPERPLPSHVLQLAAYCLLIEDTTGTRPEHGVLRYRDRSFEIPYTENLKENLLETMKAIREEDPENALPSKCRNQRKCVHCGYRDLCSGL